MRTLIVSKKYDSKKLANFILDSFPELSINVFNKALRRKDIRINGIRVKENVVLSENDEISIYISDEFLFKKINLEIVFEDDNVLIVNKPIGIEVVSNDSGKSITSILKEKYDFIEPCHRLDRNTLGLILFAKNKASLEILLDKFKNKEIKKYYKCTVYGIPKQQSATLVSYLFKDSKKSMVYISDMPKTGYQKIITSYSVVETYDNGTSLLEVEIETGKTHQIRAHLAHIGHPIIGDGKYGINSINKQFGFKYQQLHSYKLVFDFTSDSGILNYLNGKCFIKK